MSEIIIYIVNNIPLFISWCSSPSLGSSRLRGVEFARAPLLPGDSVMSQWCPFLETECVCWEEQLWFWWGGHWPSWQHQVKWNPDPRYCVFLFILVSVLNSSMSNIMVTRLPLLSSPHHIACKSHCPSAQEYAVESLLIFAVLYCLAHTCHPPTLCVLLIMPHFPSLPSLPTHPPQTHSLL